MQRSTIQWLLFGGLFFFSPALLFMVQAVIFMPAVFMLAGLLYMLPKLTSGVHLGESLSFAGFFLFHLLIFSGLYGLLSWLMAKLIDRLKSPSLRTVIALSLFGLTLLPAFYPVYGSGGHGPMRWANLAELCADFDRSYKAPVTLMVYASGLAIWACLFAGRRWMKNRQKRSTDAMLS